MSGRMSAVFPRWRSERWFSCDRAAYSGDHRSLGVAAGELLVQAGADPFRVLAPDPHLYGGVDGARRHATRATAVPALANSSALAFPMPRPAPLSRATFPLSDVVTLH
jgi:hypothetical protein